MSNPRLHIQQLQLRCRGVTPAVVETAIRNLGPELLRQLTQAQAYQAQSQLTASSSQPLAHLDLGTLPVARPAQPQHISTALAHAITTAVSPTRSQGGTQP
jgi:hypothetical protein